MCQYQDKINDIVENSEAYHSKYYEFEIFSGPSLHFQQRTLASRESANPDTFFEFIYATLASWGMHRMGPKGSKMQDFHTFKGSLYELKEEISQARRIDYRNMTDDDWAVLEKIFKCTNVMASETLLVGNSKVMAHLIPNVIPPIDREHTLKYLTGSKNIRNGPDNEWHLMRKVVENFFIPVASNQDFVSLAESWTSNQNIYPWDTSVFKVIDNLVIGAVKASKKKAQRTS